MNVFAISDLHLSFFSDKPMDRFGERWHRHWEKIQEAWRRLVTEDDVVIVAGDHSWGLKLEQARADLEFIASQPGLKVLSKGNHDLWWNSMRKLENLRLKGVHWLQNNHHVIGGVAFGGTRGWSLIGTEYCKTEEDEKIYRREVERLALSLSQLPEATKRVGVMHYPPLMQYQMDTDFTRLFEAHRMDVVVYGHLHVGHLGRHFEGEHRGVRYKLVSCDVLDFAPYKILEV